MWYNTLMSEYGESSHGQFDRISAVELELINERANDVLAKPVWGAAPDQYLWQRTGESSRQHLLLERNLADDGRDMLIGMKFEPELQGAGILVTEYVLSLDDGFFCALRERHEGAVINKSILMDMPSDTAKMLYELGQLKPDPSDLDDLNRLLDDAKDDQALQRIAHVSGGLG